MFRYNMSLPLGYMRQGYIYFMSHNYAQLSEDEQKIIRDICRKAGGNSHEALLQFMTTSSSPELVCSGHYIHHRTLNRMVRKYFLLADRVIG